MSTKVKIEIRDRIRELRRVPASHLMPHVKNWRRHPNKQKKAMRAVLKEIGYADALLARQDDSGQVILIDRHLRADVTPAPQLGGTPVTALDFRPRWIRQTLAGHQAASLSCHWPFSIHP